MFGLLNIHKPSGITSRRVVDRVQRLVRGAKAGHAGTLDPLASGVLVVCVGAATRLISYVQQRPKRYRAEFLLGRSSPTEDIEGEVCELVDPPRPRLDEVLAIVGTLRGTIQQRPPAYSALKVDGRRAYALARAGQMVELEPRPITVHRLNVVEYDYPRLALEIQCSAGTYIRSLGRDLAERLGTAAVMSALVRSAIGPFTLEDAVPLDELTAETFSAALQDALSAVSHLPRLDLTDDELARVAHGRTIADPHAGAVRELAGIDAAGQLAALLAPVGDGELRPTRTFIHNR